MDDVHDFKYIPYFFVLSGLLLFVYSLGIYGVNNYIRAILNNERLGAEISQENSYGVHAMFSIIASTYIALFYEKKRYYILSMILTLMLLASGSKASLFAFLFGMFLLFLFRYKASSKLFGSLILFGVILLISIQLPVFSGVLKRINNMFSFLKDTGNSSVDNSTRERLYMIELGITFFQRKPMFGYGLDNYKELAFPFLGRRVYSHNNYIELLVGGGLISLLLYYLSHFVIFIKSFKKTNTFTTFIIILLLVYILLDFTGPSYYSKEFYIFIGLGFASINPALNDILEKREKNE